MILDKEKRLLELEEQIRQVNKMVRITEADVLTKTLLYVKGAQLIAEHSAVTTAVLTKHLEDL